MRNTCFILFISLLIFSCGNNKENNCSEKRTSVKERSEISNLNTPAETILFDSVKINSFERDFDLESDIKLHSFIGYKNDSMYQGILTSRNGVHLDSVYFLHLKNNEKGSLPCFYGKYRFLELGKQTIFSFQVFDIKNSCEGGLGNKIVVDDFYYKIETNGRIIKLDTVLYKHPCPHVGMDC
jgi:hypothetical protein